VAYRSGDVAAAGLASTPTQLVVKLADGTETVVNLAADKPGDPPIKGAIPALQRIFRLRTTDAEKLMRGLDEYVKSDKPAPPPQGLPPGMPGGPGMPPGMPHGAAPRPAPPPRTPRP